MLGILDRRRRIPGNIEEIGRPISQSAVSHLWDHVKTRECLRVGEAFCFRSAGRRVPRPNRNS